MTCFNFFQKVFREREGEREHGSVCGFMCMWRCGVSGRQGKVKESVDEACGEMRERERERERVPATHTTVMTMKRKVMTFTTALR